MATKKSNNRNANKQAVIPNYGGRRNVVFGFLLLVVAGLCYGAVNRQILQHDFLGNEGERRYLRVVEMPAHRGVITDRNGEVLAVSAPVVSVTANPRKLTIDNEALSTLAKLLGISHKALDDLLVRYSKKSFAYLRRGMQPADAAKVRDYVRQHKLQGIEFVREYRRFYPSGEVAAHLVGITDIDSKGIEGVEYQYQDVLQGKPGAKRVIRDGKRRVVEDVENIRMPREGGDVALSIDRRLQFIAYKQLKKSIKNNRATSGSAVLLDVKTGEILAMVNQGGYNPNNLASLHRQSDMKNRAVTDVLEPGSSMKPFAVAAGLEQGVIKPNTLIDTTPGYMTVSRRMVKDHHMLGEIDLTTLLQKSSNVGAAKVALSISPEFFYNFLSSVGFGHKTESAFPGEVNGRLSDYSSWRQIDQATLSFGYGISATPLQLAAAYATLATDGVKRPVTLRVVDEPVEGTQVMRPEVATAVRHMMASVVEKGGTAEQAAIAGYKVAGKTGTARKRVNGGYKEKRYVSVFAGMAPLDNPRLVMVVVINDPRGKKYYGGDVAAPVFAVTMKEALRLLNVAPDAIELGQSAIALVGGDQ